MPGKLIYHRDDSGSARRNLTGTPSVIGRSYHAAQTNFGMIAIDRHRMIVCDSIFGQITFDLDYQQVVLRALSGVLVVVAPRCLYAFVEAGHRTHVCGALLREHRLRQGDEANPNQ